MYLCHWKIYIENGLEVTSITFDLNINLTHLVDAFIGRNRLMPDNISLKFLHPVLGGCVIHMAT